MSKVHIYEAGDTMRGMSGDFVTLEDYQELEAQLTTQVRCVNKNAEIIRKLIEEKDELQAQVYRVKKIINELDTEADQLDIEGPIAGKASANNGWLHKYELAANALRNVRDRLQAAIKGEAIEPVMTRDDALKIGEDDE